MHANHRLLVCCIAAVFFACSIASAATAPGDERRSFDIPCKYPAGLTSDGTHLYLVDWRDAKIRQIDPADGEVVRTIAAPTLRPHGLTFGDGLFYVSDDHSGWIYAVDPATGHVENSFEAPGERPTGLAYADGVLYLLERGSRKIYKVLPDDGTILKYYDAPTRNCTCLAVEGRYLWVTDRIADEFYLVNADDGQVVSILAAPGKHPAGLVVHDDHLWNVDFQDRKLRQLALRTEQQYRLSETRKARVEYLWSLYNYGPQDVTDLHLRFALPAELPNQKLLSDHRFKPEPTRFATDQWGQRCAEFELGKVDGGTTQEVTYTVNAEVSAIRWLIYPDRAGTLDDIPADIRERYTVDGARYRLNSPFIQKTVKKIIGDEQNPYWIARKVFNHLIAELKYEMVGGWDVPEVVLERGSGSCSEYTFAFIALCRAAGLPARYQGSIVVRGDDASIDEAFHRWAEIYLPNYGWVPVDANKGDAKSPADQCRGFGELANRFLITTINGGNSDHLAWGYNTHSTYKTTGYCKIEQESYGFWEPLEADANESPSKNATSAGECRP